MANTFSSKSIFESRDGLVKGRFIGVGVGPGDPELITLKAFRLIQQAPVIAYLTNKDGRTQALAIAQEAFELKGNDTLHIGINMPMSLDRRLANRAYDEGAKQIQAALDKGLDVIFLCEGDPLFFGSFAYLLERLNTQYSCLSVPGISSVHAASSALVTPLTLQEESFAIISGRHTQAQLEASLMEHDSLVIMKAGKSRPKILAALNACGRLEEANYLEYIGREAQHLVTDVTQLEPTEGPYFSLFLVTPSGLKRQGHYSS